MFFFYRFSIWFTKCSNLLRCFSFLFLFFFFFFFFYFWLINSHQYHVKFCLRSGYDIYLISVIWYLCYTELGLTVMNNSDSEFFYSYFVFRYFDKLVFTKRLCRIFDQMKYVWMLPAQLARIIWQTTYEIVKWFCLIFFPQFANVTMTSTLISTIHEWSSQIKNGCLKNKNCTRNKLLGH